LVLADVKNVHKERKRKAVVAESYCRWRRERVGLGDADVAEVGFIGE